MKFKLHYFLLFLLIFVTEVCIALFIHDDFIRPYLGDVLVVILIYCFLKSFVDLSVRTACVLVLAFAFLVEFLQYCNTVERLGLQHNKIARTVIGTSFSWIDILTYIIGIAIVWISENKKPGR